MTLLDRVIVLRKKVWGRRPYVLAHRQTPKPMHTVVPRLILGKKWWDTTRLKAFADTEGHCRTCGIHRVLAQGRKYLEGHEIYQADYVRGKWTYLETVGICHYCHNYIHCGRLTNLLEKGEITRFKFRAIMDHGNRVLEEVGLERPKQYEGPIAKWEDWRLILFGKEYLPKFKNYQEWYAYHFSLGNDNEN